MRGTRSKSLSLIEFYNTCEYTFQCVLLICVCESNKKSILKLPIILFIEIRVMCVAHFAFFSFFFFHSVFRISFIVWKMKICLSLFVSKSIERTIKIWRNYKVRSVNFIRNIFNYEKWKIGWWCCLNSK